MQLVPWLLAAALPQLAAALLTSGQCLTSVAVADISEEAANLTWTFVCDPSLVSGFKIWADHARYLACPEEVNRSFKTTPTQHIKKTVRTGAHERWQLIGRSSIGVALEPHSEYELKVVPLFRDRRPTTGLTVVAATQPALPALKLRVRSAETRADSVTFLLEDLDTESCHKFNGELGFIRYQVRGLSEWNRDFFLLEEVDWRQRQLAVAGLLPHSRYGLNLFLTNEAGLYLDTGAEAEPDFAATTKPLPPAAAPGHLRLEVRGAECSVFWRDVFPPRGEADFYLFSWRLGAAAEWSSSDKIWAQEVQSLASGERYYTMPIPDTVDTVSVKMKAFNKGFPQGSAWSAVVSNAGGSLETVLSIVGAAVLMALLILFTFFVARRWRLQRYSGFEQTKTSDYTEKPIIRSLSREPAAPGRRDSAAASLANSSPASVELRAGRGGGHRRSGIRSGLDPLPPVPGQQENIYEEPRDPRRPEPESQPLDEDNYLAPNPVKVASVESLDEEGYLKPNFRRYQPINTKSPSRESPEPIPMVSYSSQDELERG